MKNTFDLARFGRVLRYTWVTQPVLPYIVLVAVLPLIFLYLLRTAAAEGVSIFSDDPYLMFNTYFFGCGWLYAGLSFSEFNRFGSASRFLLLPGSVLEKWLAKVLLTFFVFPLITWISFNLAYQGLALLSARLLAFRFSAIDWHLLNMQASLFLYFLTLPAAFASGIVWKRFGFLKGLVFVFVLFILMYFITIDGINRYNYTLSLTVLFGEINLPFAEWDCLDGTRVLIHLFWILACYLPALLFLGSTYVMMKEKEV